MSKRKETVETEITTCDICGQDDISDSNPCLHCGSHVCYDCRRSGKVKTYQGGLNYTGIGQGVYCLPCDQTLNSGFSTLHNAYVEMERIQSVFTSVTAKLVAEAAAIEEQIDAATQKESKV